MTKQQDKPKNEIKLTKAQALATLSQNEQILIAEMNRWLKSNALNSLKLLIVQNAIENLSKPETLETMKSLKGTLKLYK